MLDLPSLTDNAECPFNHPVWAQETAIAAGVVIALAIAPLGELVLTGEPGLLVALGVVQFSGEIVHLQNFNRSHP